jgi:hypothetical protein
MNPHRLALPLLLFEAEAAFDRACAAYKKISAGCTPD